MAVLCSAALQLVNLVRSAQFYEEVSRGSLYLIGERLASDEGALPRLEAAFDASIAIRPEDDGQ